MRVSHTSDVTDEPTVIETVSSCPNWARGCAASDPGRQSISGVYRGTVSVNRSGTACPADTTTRPDDDRHRGREDGPAERR